MSRLVFLVIFLIINAILGIYTLEYSKFYIKTAHFSSAEAKNLSFTANKRRQSIICEVFYSYTVENRDFTSSKLEPWQKGLFTNGREPACSLHHSSHFIVRYDPNFPENAFLKGNFPINHFIIQSVSILFLIYFLFYDRKGRRSSFHFLWNH